MGDTAPREADLAGTFHHAMDAWEAEAYEEASTHLRSVFDVSPSYYDAQHGSVAYWLGRALRERDQRSEALAVWQQGLLEMADAGMFETRLADAFIRTVYIEQEEDAYAFAGDVYFELLSQVEWADAGVKRELVERHLRPLAWVLPPALASEIGLGPWVKATDSDARIQLKAGAGEALVVWWRSQDVLPATPANERLEEHLRRVAVAEERYRDSGRLDDRARVYIRLGEPYKTTRVRFNSPEFTNKVVFRQLTLSAFDFPENEFWLYEHIDHAAYFLFVKEDDYYRLGEPNDLAPRTLRQGLNKSERGIRKSEALIRTFEEIYRELSLVHDDFAIRYQDVADFAELLDQQEMLSQAEVEEETMRQGGNLKGTVRDVSGTQATPTRTDLLPALPHVFSQEIVARSTYEDGMAAERRAERVPIAYSELLGEADPLPVALRTARFLDEDGTTRTEVYWSVLPGGFTLSSPVRKRQREAGYPQYGPYQINVLAAQRTPDHRNRALHLNRHLIYAEPGDERDAIAPQQVTLPADTGRYHVALQWEVYPVRVNPQGKPADAGPLAFRAAALVDSLDALAASPARLEVSDLKPFFGPDDGLVEDEVPYPFGYISADMPLGLYFEVYHLAYGADDLAHFDVAYRVTRRRDGRLLRRGRAETTSATVERTSAARTSPETILIDPGEWAGADEVEITVTITDTTSGQQVERSIAFAVVD